MASLLKTRILRPAAVTALGLVLTLLLTGCDQRELCYDHDHRANLAVIFDWTKASDADVKGMTALFFNEERPDRDDRYDMVGMEGDTIRLQPGTYRAVAYNNDTEAILYRGTNSATSLEAYTRYSSISEGTQINTRGVMPMAEGTEDEKVILEPDVLFGGASDYFTLVPDGSETITIAEEHRTMLVHIVFANVKNLKYASMFGGSLSGLAPSVNVRTGRLGEGCVTEAFQGHKTDETTLELSVRIFGHCPRLSEGKTNRHVLTIYCVMEDGTQWYHSVDITDQLHAEDPQPTPAPGEEEKVINIALEDLPLPELMGDGEGGMFQPTIDGWQGVEIDVSIDY